MYYPVTSVPHLLKDDLDLPCVIGGVVYLILESAQALLEFDLTSVFCKSA